MADERIRFDIQISATAAIAQLKQIANKSKDAETAISRLGDFFATFSQKTKTPLKEVSRLFQEIDKELTSLGKAPIFGEYEDDIYKFTEKFNQMRQAAGIFKVDNQGVVTSLSAVEDRAMRVAEEIKKLYSPQQQRNALGQFQKKTFPDFGTEIKKLTDYNERLRLVQRTIEGISKKTGASFREVGTALEKAFPELKNTNLASTAIDNLNKKTMGLAGTFKSLKQVASQVDAELAKMAKSGKLAFAGTNKENVASVVSALKEIKTTTGASFEQAAAGMRRMGVDGAYVRQGLQQVNQELSATEKSIKKTGDAMERAGKKAQGFRHGIDVVRTALGTLLAVGIFQFLSLLTSTFQTLIHNVRETELAIYNLINAERRLSEQGIEVTPKGLQETIDAVRELVPVLSKIQAEELVSRIATNVAPALKLTNEQIKQMAEATALLYIRNKALGKSFDEVEAQLTNAFLTGKVSQGINNLGVKISDQIVRDEALRMGLVKTEKEFDNLTGEMEAQVKAAAMLSVVYKNASQDIDSMNEYMQTSDAQISRASTAWNDFLTAAGQAFGPVIAQGAEMIAFALELIVKLLEATAPALEHIVTLSVAWVETMRNMPQYFKLGGGKLFAENFKKNFDDVKKSFEGLADATDTATQAQDGYNDAVEELNTEALEKAADIFKDTADAAQDLAEKLIQKLEDLDLEYQRKALDAETDYLRKQEDINRDYQRDLAKLKQKHREEDERDEAKYQLALWELRQRFLMDLEDALHARDARQVIRLQKQYNLDKEVLRRKHELEEKEREDSQRNELEDLERRRRERLEDARLEYEQKLADLNIAKQREAEDLQKWYMRELEDLKQSQERKLQELLAGWAKEQELTEANAAQIYAILRKYFGPGGMTDELYKYMMDSLLQVTAQAAAVAAQIGQIGGRDMSGEIPAPVVPGIPKLPGEGKISEDAMGSLALVPTNSMFGSVPASVPLNRIGKESGGVFGGQGGSAMDGSIAIEVLLSPDLEARVVRNSMDGVAGVIAKVVNSK